MKRKIIVSAFLCLVMAICTFAFAACADTTTPLTSGSLSESDSNAASASGDASGDASASETSDIGSHASGSASASSSASASDTSDDHEPSDYTSDEIRHYLAGDTAGEFHSFKAGVCTKCGRNVGDPTLGLNFTDNGDETVTVSEIGTASLSEKVIIPSEVNGKAVVAMKAGAFYSEIEGGEDSEGNPQQNQAVSNTSAKYIYIPASVQTIGVKPYAYFEKLEAVFVDLDNPNYFGNGTGIIDRAARTFVAGCNNTVIPADGSVTKIGEGALAGSNIAELVVPDGVTEIGYEAFYNCTRLRSLSIPDSVEFIGQYAISNKNSSLQFHDEDKLSYIGNANNPYVFLYTSDSDISAANVHEGTRFIASLAFLNRASLKTVNIASTVKGIGGNAFETCTALNAISVPNSVTYIGVSAFTGCTALSQVSLGSGITEISDKTFYNCSNIVTITLPDGVKKIGANAFDGCSGLENANLGKSLEFIGTSAFSYCKLLENVSVPDTIINIAGNAFQGCTSIGFYKENGMNYIGNETNNYVILVSVDDKSQETYNINANTKIIGGGLSTGGGNGGGAFEGCDSLTHITLPAGLKTVGDYAFSGCSLLTEIQLPSELKYISKGAFTGTGLVSVVVPDGVEYIGNDSFGWCPNLVSIVIPTSVTSFEAGFLQYCMHFRPGYTPDPDDPDDKNGIIFYKGNQADWDAIEKEITYYYQYVMNPAAIYFLTDSDPADGGNYWHFVGDVPTPWGK